MREKGQQRRNLLLGCREIVHIKKLWARVLKNIFMAQKAQQNSRKMVRKKLSTAKKTKKFVFKRK